MQCQNCRAEIPAGMAFCSNCGAPVSAAANSSPNQGIPPTVAASSPNQGLPPTIMASPSTPPSTPYEVAGNYGQSAPPPPSNPYEIQAQAAPPPPYDPTLPPYGAPPQVPYGTPQQAPYITPGAYAPQPYLAPQQPKKKNGCVIAAVIVGVLLILIVGGVIAAGAYVVHTVNIASANATATANAQTPATTSTSGLTDTPTTSTSNVPSASQIDHNAAANVTSVQTSLGMDSNYKPTNPTTSFHVGDTVDLTFTVSGNAGYITTKIFQDGQFAVQSDTPLTIQSGYTNGGFHFTAGSAGQYVAGLYWCTKSDCSDAALAQVANFTVS